MALLADPPRARPDAGHPRPPAGLPSFLRPRLVPQVPPPAPAPRRRWRAAALALLLAPLLVLLGLEVPAPAFVAARLEAAAASGGGSLRIGAVTMRLTPSPRLRVADAALLDAGGREVARAEGVTATLSLAGLARGRALVREVRVEGLALSLAPGGPGGLPEARDLAALPARLDRLLARPDLAALARVRVEGLRFDGGVWSLDAGALGLDVSGEGARLTGEGTLDAWGTSARATMRYDAPGGRAGRLDVALADVTVAALDAPLSATLRAEVDASGTLLPVRAEAVAGAGSIRVREGPSIGLDSAHTELSLDAATGALRVAALEVRTERGGLAAQGRLDPDDAGLAGRLRLTNVVAAPPGIAPLSLGAGDATVRLRLDPLALEVEEAGLPLGDGRMVLSGRVAAAPEGWDVALDARVADLGLPALLALAPPGPLRLWAEGHMSGGRVTEAAVALRRAPDAAPVVAVSARFEGVAVRALASHPPVEGAAGRLAYAGGRLAVALEAGEVAAPEGGAVDLAGTTLAVSPGARSLLNMELSARAPVTALLSLLDVAPYGFPSAAGLPVDLAEGRASVTGPVDLRLGLPAGAPPGPDDLRYDLAAVLTEVRSDALVPGRTVAAERLDARATREGIEVSGPARVGATAVEGSWAKSFAQAGSTLAAQVELSPASLAEWGVALPEGAVAGEGSGDLRIDLRPGEAPRLSLRSDLRGLALALPAVGWSKPAEAGGALLVEGSLGSPARIDALALDAPGLSAEGTILLAPGGALDRLELSRLAVGDWLDAPVTLVAREGGSPAVVVGGGRLDLRAATFGEGGGEGGPVRVALDRLEVTDGIALTDLVADLDAAAGLEGTFRGRVNGGPEVSGRVAPQGGRVGARVQGDDAGAVLRAANLFARAEGGALDLLLVPEGASGWRGEAWIGGITVRDAPVLASLLNAVSVVGLLQQLRGRGIVFDEVGALFRVDGALVTVERSSATGPGLGLSLDGTFDTEAAVMDFRGVVSPVYLLNGVGAFLTRPGEGLLGFNYSLRGTPEAPEVGVNPLSALAPGFFRDILRPRG